MKSMTGYGYSSYKDDEYILEVEIKSYNSRFLEIQHNINYALSSFESYMDSRLKEVASRGHIDLSVRLKVLSSSSSVNVDEKALNEYKKAYERMGRITGLNPAFSDYLGADGIITLVRSEDAEVYRKGLEKALSEALGQLNEAKIREGAATHDDLLRLGNEFKASVDFVASESDEIESYFRTLFSSRYNELLSDKELDEDRLTQEVTLLILKHSINEEIKRLYAHLDEYFKLLESDGSVGKRLDFLAQELIRETNTIASKSAMATLSSMTIRMKESIENIREQVRNIE